MLVSFNFAKHVNVIKINVKKFPRQTKIFPQFKYKECKSEQTNYKGKKPISLENQNILTWGSSKGKSSE